MRFSKLAGTLVLSLLSVLAFQSEAESHGRAHYYRYYRYYSSWPSWPYWGSYYAYPALYYGGFYGAPHPYSRLYYGTSDRAPSALRIEVKPVEAEVYVDGYLAGNVDEFDGFFQRLNLTPGAHEVVIYLDGHRTLREKLYLSPGASYRLRRTIAPLAPGETTEGRPEPPREREAEPERSTSVSDFGVLALRVQPPDAEISIDSEPWPSGDPSEELVIHLPAGEHRIEIRKAGHAPFVTDVSVEPGKTTTLNVKLPYGRPRKEMEMKKTLLFAAALALSGMTARASAQSTETEELERIQSGFVVAPDFKLSEVDGESANLLGGYAGWLTDRKLFIGAGAYWLTNGTAGSELAYGGALVEWFAQRNEKFNLSFRGLVGAGTGTLGVDIGDFPEAPQGRFGGRGGRGGRFPHRFPSTILVHEGFFVAEPQANASFTFTNWLRLGVGAGYRLIGGASGLESRFRGPTASVSLQFGKFY